MLRVDSTPTQATERERRGAEIFFGKGQCVGCHPPPTYLDHQMHDLKVERFVNEAPLGPMKTFTLRGIKDSPPYLHDGRCLTLEDTTEFFNLVVGLQLSAEEKQDLAAFVKVLYKGGGTGVLVAAERPWRSKIPLHTCRTWVGSDVHKVLKAYHFASSITFGNRGALLSAL